jgi:hypothetical protein
MCLIAFVPKGKSLSRDVIDNANKVNPDGIGIMSPKGVEKFYGNKQLKRARNFIAALAAEGLPHAVHWRFATHGSRGLALCHPFKLPHAEAYLMHNGVIGATAQDASEDASDTLLYVNKLINAPLTYKSGDDLSYWNERCNEIGSNNKAIVMYPDGQFIILNQDQGTIIEDIWYSNQYSLPLAMRQTSSYFVPARLRPPSTWSGHQGGYYSNYSSGYQNRTGGDSAYTRYGSASPFGDLIYWSQLHKCYGFWVGAKFQKLVVTEGEVVNQHEMGNKPTQGTLDMTKLISEAAEDTRKCPRCMRFKKDPPMGYLPCWCTDEALKRYYDNVEGKLEVTARLAGPSGPTLGDEEKPAPKPSTVVIEGCEHGEPNWENCRDCIAELEADTSSGFKQWLEDRKGHNWRLQSPDNGGHPSDRADELAKKIIYLPRASNK